MASMAGSKQPRAAKVAWDAGDAGVKIVKPMES